MKTIILTPARAISALALFTLSPAIAQTVTRPGPANDRPAAAGFDTSDKLQIAPPEAVDHTLRKLAGQNVYGANGEKLGTIKDFVVDKKTGHVVYAVVSSGGVLGAGNTLRLVPIHALQSAPAGTPGFTVRISRANWDRSPELIDEAFSAGIVTVSEDHHRMHTELYGDASNTRTAPPRANPASPLPRSRDAELAASPWVRASMLRGKDIHSAGQEIGEIEEIVIDLNRKTATALVDLEDDIMGGDRRILVPLTELGLTAETRDTLATTLTRQDFVRLDPALRHRADATVVPTGRGSGEPNAPTGADATLASAARSARQALDNHADLSRADIRVSTENGMLILRGRVPSEKLKEKAEDAVEDAASGIRLQNYLIIDPR